jgi:hypothetical protein
VTYGNRGFDDLQIGIPGIGPAFAVYNLPL